jgi:hypothetical protein
MINTHLLILSHGSLSFETQLKYFEDTTLSFELRVSLF